MHLPTTETTREVLQPIDVFFFFMFVLSVLQYIGARNRYRSDESRTLHNDLVRQADERSRLQKINRFQDNIAELQVELSRRRLSHHGQECVIYSLAHRSSK